MFRKITASLAGLVCAATSFTAYAQAFGSWVAETADSFFWAGTSNDSGALLGQFCYPANGSCMWFLGISSACKEGEQYPVLANSDAGAAQLQVLCSSKVENGLYRYVFTDFEAADELVKKGMQIGFAVPLQSDQFHVVRFNLEGSNLAVAAMRAAAESKAPSTLTNKKRTRDEFM